MTIDGWSCLSVRNQPENPRTQPPSPEKSFADLLTDNDWEGAKTVIRNLERRNMRLETELTYYKNVGEVLASYRDRLVEARLTRAEQLCEKEREIRDLKKTHIIALMKSTTALAAKEDEIALLKQVGIFPWSPGPMRVGKTDRFADLEMITPEEAFNHKQNEIGGKI